MPIDLKNALAEWKKVEPEGLKTGIVEALKPLVLAAKTAPELDKAIPPLENARKVLEAAVGLPKLKADKKAHACALEIGNAVKLQLVRFKTLQAELKDEATRADAVRAKVAAEKAERQRKEQEYRAQLKPIVEKLQEALFAFMTHPEKLGPVIEPMQDPLYQFSFQLPSGHPMAKKIRTWSTEIKKQLLQNRWVNNAKHEPLDRLNAMERQILNPKGPAEFKVLKGMTEALTSLVKDWEEQRGA